MYEIRTQTPQKPSMSDGRSLHLSSSSSPDASGISHSARHVYGENWMSQSSETTSPDAFLPPPSESERLSLVDSRARPESNPVARPRPERATALSSIQLLSRPNMSSLIVSLMGSGRHNSETSSSGSDHSHATTDDDDDDDDDEGKYLSDIWKGTGISKGKEPTSSLTNPELASAVVSSGVSTVEHVRSPRKVGFVPIGAFTPSELVLRSLSSGSTRSESGTNRSARTSLRTGRIGLQWIDLADHSTFNFLNLSRLHGTATEPWSGISESPSGLTQYLISTLDPTTSSHLKTETRDLFELLGFSGGTFASSERSGKTNEYFSVHHNEPFPDIQVLSSLSTIRERQIRSRYKTIARFPSLPSEIVQSIYMYLHPKDFNAARHTCRAWMNVSLDRALLKLMLKRGAWWSSSEHMLWGRLRHSYGEAELHTDSSIWLLSCLLSRECALTACWIGNGLKRRNTDAIPVCEHHRGIPPTPSCSNPRSALRNMEVFRQTAIIDFRELTGHALLGQSVQLVFQTSVCGKYVLVAEGGIVYVYELFGDDLCALTSVTCPRGVLAMSMDVSSGRFAFAALLEGRLGIMCDLIHGIHTFSSKRGISPSVIVESSIGHRQSQLSTNFKTRRYSNNDRLKVPNFSTASEPQDDLEHNPDQTPEVFQVHSSKAVHTVEDDFTEVGRENASINRTWNLHMPSLESQRRSKVKRKDYGGIPVETGSRSLYHQLCSDDDPPRSVSICPQRRCVAFGCSVGLELHWVDALTSQDLNRWFPLTGPSDYLHFLLPRREIDAPTKLRLISSTAHPSQRRTISRQFSTSQTQHGFRDSWNSTGSNSIHANNAELGSDSDHFHAVPVSDGFHILFTDPDSGMLCIGSDAPIGNPRRLLRKIILYPPTAGVNPRLYSPSADTQQGLRIVAAYKDEIYLYSIPSDVLDLSRWEQEPNGVSDEQRRDASIWLRWWPPSDMPADYSPIDTESELEAGGSLRSIWPLVVRGAYVGTLSKLVDVASQCRDGLISIWGFALDGQTAVWQIDTNRPDACITVRDISHGGRVMSPFSIDSEGDVVMSDTRHASSGIGSSTLAHHDPSMTADVGLSSYERRATADDSGRSAIFQVQHDHDDEFWEGPEFHESSETGLSQTNIPFEIHTSRKDDVDVYRE